MGYQGPNNSNEFSQFWPREVPAMQPYHITHIAAGTHHTAAVADSRDIFCFGFGKAYPRKIMLFKHSKPTIRQVAAGGSNLVVVTTGS